VKAEIEWRAVPGWEGCYEVSSAGDVRSIDRVVAGRLRRGRVLRPSINNKGYRQLGLSDGPRKLGTCVHRLVALAFVENPNGLPEVNHIDCNKLNNAPDNLEWCSASHNSRHSTANHLNPVAKLSDDQVRTIRQRAKAGSKIRHMAKEYGVAPACIRRVVRLRTYTWVN
jgi:hypothetical protein